MKYSASHSLSQLNVFVTKGQDNPYMLASTFHIIRTFLLPLPYDVETTPSSCEIILLFRRLSFLILSCSSSGCMMESWDFGSTVAPWSYQLPLCILMSSFKTMPRPNLSQYQAVKECRSANLLKFKIVV